MTASPLRAWFRRDRWFLGGLALCAFVTLLSAAYADDFWRTWVLPVGAHDSLLLGSWLLGIGMAFAIVLRESALGLELHARHRSIPAHSRIRSRMLAAIAILALAPPLVAAVQWSVEAIFGDFVSVGSWSNAGALAALTTTSLSSLAISTFALQLQTSLPMRIALGGSLHLGLYSLADMAIRTQGSWTTTPTALILANLSLAVAFAWLSWLQEPTRYDRDRPMRGSPARGAIIAAASAALLFAYEGLAASRTEAIKSYHRAGPEVAELRNGDIELLYPHDGSFRRQADGGPAVEGIAGSLPPSSAFSVPKPFVRPPRFPPAHSRNRDAWIVDGLVHIVRREYSGFRLASLRSAALPKDDSGLRFGPDARLVTLRRTADADGLAFRDTASDETWVLEPGAEQIWRVDRTALRLHSLPLPSGQTVESHLNSRHFRARSTDGARVIYAFNEDGSLRVDGVSGIAPLTDRIRILGNVFTPQIEVTRKDGGQWTQRIEMGTAPRYALAAVAISMSVAQPPAAALLSALTAEPDERFGRGWHPLADPILANGQMAWVLALCLAMGALSAWGAARYLTRIGAPREVRRTWTVFCALGGPTALLLSVLLERPRAYRTLPVEAPSPPLIETRRSA